MALVQLDNIRFYNARLGADGPIPGHRVGSFAFDKTHGDNNAVDYPCVLDIFSALVFSG
jgi:hypothetical protein